MYSLGFNDPFSFVYPGDVLKEYEVMFMVRNLFGVYDKLLIINLN